MKDKYDEQARTVMHEVLGHLLGDGTFPVDGVKVIATALRSATQSGRARAEAIEDALRELLVCHAEGGFIEPGTDVLSEAWDALNLLPTNDAAIAKALDVSDE